MSIPMVFSATDSVNYPQNLAVENLMSKGTGHL